MRYENSAGFFSAADPAPAGKELESLMAGTKVSRVNTPDPADERAQNFSSRPDSD